MRLTMLEKRTISKAWADRYRRASKKEKGRILDDVVDAPGYNRVYAARLLRHHGQRVQLKPGVVLEGSVRVKAPPGPRKALYGPEVLKALKKVWKIMDYLCGKRLAPMLAELVPLLARQGELRIRRKVQRQLVQMSPATIDRLLAPEHKKAALKGRSRTKPGVLLKHQAPVRTFADWNEMRPGFMELDLVAHDGGSSHGGYCQVLDATDVCTGWSEQFAVPTKAQCWVFEAITQMRGRLPFELLGIDSDNGGEFINHHLVRYCNEEKIAFTRSRACKKNDNCFVEQKNWSIVRRFSGYARYEGHEACQALNELYAAVSLYVNHFTSSMKLVEKIRNGARVTKRYDKTQTPYARVLASPHIVAEVKSHLRQRHATLNPAELKREIERIQARPGKLAIRLRSGMPSPPKPGANHPWRIRETHEHAG